MILVSPSLEILLLHRVQTSSSFPSAHVFPGGNIDKQDGYIPEDGIKRHQDNQAYRVGALRELFEESGILLARQHVQSQSQQLLSLPQSTREEGRKLVHSNKTSFQDWLNQQNHNAVLDTDTLIPFSHWITPPHIPKRFTTQMYLYILPISEASDSEATEPTLLTTPAPTSEASSFTATSDGGLENTAATFSPASTWLQLAQSGSIILFPPQFLLLHLMSQFLDNQALPPTERVTQLKDFASQKQENGVSWSEMCISPYALAMQKTRADGKQVLALDKPGLEVELVGKREGKGVGLRGDKERVVLVRFSKEGPRQVEVRWRREVLEEGRVGEKL